MKTPNVTQAQIAAILGSLGAVLAIVYQAPERLQVPLLIVLGAIAVAWILADGLGIRPGRAKVAAATHALAAAEITAAAATANLDQGDLPDAPAK